MALISSKRITQPVERDDTNPDFIKQEKTFILYVPHLNIRHFQTPSQAKREKTTTTRDISGPAREIPLPFAICHLPLRFRFVMKKTCRRCSRLCLEYIADSPSPLPKSSRRCKDVLCCGDAELCVLFEMVCTCGSATHAGGGGLQNRAL